MNWIIGFSERAIKFLARNHIRDEQIIEKVRLVIQKFRGEAVSVDVKKIKGKWSSFYRIRSGRIRIIATFSFTSRRVFVDTIDWRGNVYK